MASKVILTPKAEIVRPITPKPPYVFKLDDSFFKGNNGQVMVSGWGYHFEKFFGGKEEAIATPRFLKVYVLGEGASDRDIVDHLGGEDVVEITMGEFWEQIALQGYGELGDLSVNRYTSNAGYAKDAKGVFRLVGVHWRRGDIRYRTGWFFDAFEFPCALWRSAGHHVIAP